MELSFLGSVNCGDFDENTFLPLQLYFSHSCTNSLTCSSNTQSQACTHAQYWSISSRLCKAHRYNSGRDHPNSGIQNKIARVNLLAKRMISVFHNCWIFYT